MEHIVKERIAQKLHIPVDTLHFQAVGGGSINDSFKIIINNKPVCFIKINSASRFPQLFEKEQKGLALIAQQDIIQVPKVVEHIVVDDYQLLILEWIQSGEKNNTFWKKFGEQLAALHHCSSATFGLDYDNYMGSVPQLNTPNNSWTNFFIHQRLQLLVKKCLEKNLLTLQHIPLFEKLYTQLPNIFNTEPPALLHGDLWSGNYMCNATAEPVLIDPAIYYGHRSVDLAMTTLFGGFRTAFYEAYQYHYPFPKNYQEQWDICNLYPLLIHLLLFGTGYLSAINKTLKAFQ